MNPQLKKLMKKLGDAINTSLSESEPIAQAIAGIKSEGYDVFLVLEATIGFNRHAEASADAPELVRTSKNIVEPEFSVNANDLRFLKSLRISVDDSR